MLFLFLGEEIHECSGSWALGIRVVSLSFTGAVFSYKVFGYRVCSRLTSRFAWGSWSSGLTAMGGIKLYGGGAHPPPPPLPPPPSLPLAVLCGSCQQFEGASTKDTCGII